MRVIFMGTPEFAVPTLDAIVEAGHEVVLVVSRPDTRQGRGKKLTSPPVIQRARELGLPTSQPRAIRRGSFPERVVSLHADVAVVLAYGRILTPELLHAPIHGCVNVHGSLLPRWRGAAPIQAAILAGDRVTGVCTQRMEEGLDTGDLYLCKQVPVGASETAGELYERLMRLSAEVAVQTLAELPTLTPTPQTGEVTWCGLISKADGELHLHQSAVNLDRRVRAMSPWPGGWLALERGRLKVLSTALAEGEGPPGVVLSTDPLVIGTGAGALELVRVQAPSRKPVRGADYANGAHLSVGDVVR